MYLTFSNHYLFSIFLKPNFPKKPIFEILKSNGWTPHGPLEQIGSDFYMRSICLRCIHNKWFLTKSRFLFHLWQLFSNSTLFFLMKEYSLSIRHWKVTYYKQKSVSTSQVSRYIILDCMRKSIKIRLLIWILRFATYSAYEADMGSFINNVRF